MEIRESMNGMDHMDDMEDKKNAGNTENGAEGKNAGNGDAPIVKEIRQDKTIQRIEIEKARVKILKAMHEIISSLNDEEAYMDWIEIGVPDEPVDDDFRFIASDETSYKSVLDAFKRIYTEYADSGFCV